MRLPLYALALLLAAAPAPAAAAEKTTVTVLSAKQAEALTADVNAVMISARVIPNFVDGSVNGFKLFQVTPGGAWDKLGFKNQDVLRTVNGVAVVDDPARLTNLFQQIHEHKSVEVGLERGGKKLKHRVKIK